MNLYPLLYNIFFFNPDYVTARSLHSLRSKWYVDLLPSRWVPKKKQPLYTETDTMLHWRIKGGWLEWLPSPHFGSFFLFSFGSQLKFLFGFINKLLRAKPANKTFFPNVRELLIILAVLPIGSTEAGRSFSCSPRIHTWLRNAMAA